MYNTFTFLHEFAGTGMIFILQAVHIKAPNQSPMNRLHAIFWVSNIS